MADSIALKQQLEAADTARNIASSLVGPATDAAQQAYDRAEFFNPEGKKFSDTWTGSFNGQTFSDPYALYAAAKADFQLKADKRTQLAVDFNNKLSAYNDLKAQVDALPPESNAGQEASTNSANANSTANAPATGVTQVSTTSDTSSTNPTNDNAGQKNYSDNASQVPADSHGPAYDDDGNLMPGFSKDENNNPVWVGGGFVEPATQESANASRIDAQKLRSRSLGSAGAPAQATWKEAADLRTILRVPPKYITQFTDPSGQLSQFGGIVFPYTPTLGYNETATYNAINPLHSNYTIYTYKNSAVGAISLSAKFTVQNEKDGLVLLGVIHLLRALTKMKFGPDSDAGAPPPVCRLNAYGTFMLKNIPVTVADFRHDLPDGVDYIAVGRSGGPFGPNLLPALSTITLTLNPTYSRSEMMAAGVDTWLSGGFAGKGYL
jgi:hypothetical protein